MLRYVTLTKRKREQRVSTEHSFIHSFLFFKVLLGFGLDFEFGLGLEFRLGLGLG